MTPKEEQRCKRLLSLLDDEDLSSLLCTVMKRPMHVNRKEAIGIIISRSSSAAELLQRKKVGRKVIHRYLTSKGISVPANAEKSDLICRVLSRWESPLPVDKKHMISKGKTSLARPALQSSPAETTTIFSQQSSDSNMVYANPVSHTPTEKVTDFTQPATGSSSFLAKSPERKSPAPTTMISKQNLFSQTSGPGTFVRGTSAKSSSHTVLSTQGQETNHKLRNQVMGKEFATWFYKLLNAGNPALNCASELSLGSGSFWENSSLKIFRGTINSPEETYTGSLRVVQRLDALVKDENLMFNPNFSDEGVRTIKSPYGHFMVMVCGTIHQKGVCVGAFNQIFGLAEDPSIAGNWKIKITSLHIENCKVTSFPTIRHTADQDMLRLAEESMTNQIL